MFTEKSDTKACFDMFSLETRLEIVEFLFFTAKRREDARSLLREVKARESPVPVWHLERMNGANALELSKMLACLDYLGFLEEREVSRIARECQI